MPDVKDGISTLSKKNKTEYYAWDSRISIQIDDPMCTACLRSRKKVVDFDTEVKVNDNDIVDEDDGKETTLSVSPFSREK